MTTLCQASALHSATCGDDDETENAPCPNVGTETVTGDDGVSWLLCSDCKSDLDLLLSLADRLCEANPEAVAEIERRRGEEGAP